MQFLSPPIFPVLSAAPSSPSNGMVYIDSALGALRARIAGAWVTLGEGGGSPAADGAWFSYDMSVAGRYGGSVTGTGSVRTLGNTVGAILTAGTASGGRADVFITPEGGGDLFTSTRRSVCSWFGGLSTQGTEADMYYVVASNSSINAAAGPAWTTTVHAGFVIELRAGTRTWKASHCDGSGVRTTTTFTAPTDTGNLELVVVFEFTDVAEGAIKFYCNGLLVATHTTDLPAASLGALHAGISNRSTTTLSTIRCSNMSFWRALP
jgi:hypothetical protein